MSQETFLVRQGGDADLADITATTVTASSGFTGDLTGDVTGDVTGGVLFPTALASADGALTVTKSTIIRVTKAGVCAMTLAAPAADGILLIVTSKTAAAHTLTVTGGAAGAAQDVGTFGGAINDSCTLVSAGSEWHVVSTRNVTFA